MFEGLPLLLVSSGLLEGVYHICLAPLPVSSVLAQCNKISLQLREVKRAEVKIPKLGQGQIKVK